MTTMRTIVLIFALISGLVMVACSQSGSSPAATATPTAAGTSQGPTPTTKPVPSPTVTLVPTPTPTQTPKPMTAKEILASCRDKLREVTSLAVEMDGAVVFGDLSIPFELKGEMELPDKAHGFVGTQEEYSAFLRISGQNYVSTWYDDYSEFESDRYNDSGVVFLEILEPLLSPDTEEPFTDLERLSDETVNETEYYRIGIRLDMADFVEDFIDENLRGMEVKGRGEILIEKSTLLPHQFNVTCEKCLISSGLGFGADLTTEFTLSSFNEPVSIPGPRDRPVLLPVTKGSRARDAEFEAQNSEFQTIVTAVSAMMVDNNRTSIPNPVSGHAPPCTVGTKDLSAFPDSISIGGTPDKAIDPSGNRYSSDDKPGYLLYRHDINANGNSDATVNYVAVGTSAYCYTIASDGRVTQYDLNGFQINPSAQPAPPPTVAPWPTTAPAPTAAPARPTVAPARYPTATPAPVSVIVPTPVPADGTFYMKAIGADEARYGGHLKLAAHGPPAHFDIYGSGTIANAGSMSPMYDLLVRMDPRDPANLPIIPSLATGWDISSDGLSYTFALREGVKFHDGSDFDALDVQATFDRIVNPTEGLVSLRNIPINDMTINDSYSITMTLSETKDAYTFLGTLAGGWNVISSAETLKSEGGDFRRVDNFPGTGPFKYQKRTTETWVQKKNESYWNPNAPYVDSITHYWLKAWTPELAAALLGGQVDWGMWLDPKTYQVVLAREDMAGLLWKVPNLSSWIGFNNGREPLNDARVRRAMHLALDQIAIDNITRGFTANELADWLPPPYGKTYDELVRAYPNAAETRAQAEADAKALMAEAGYADGIDKTFDFVVRESPQNRQVATFAQAEWDRLLGIKTELEVVQVSDMVEFQTEGTFDIISPASCLGGTDLAATLMQCYGYDMATGEAAESNFTNFRNDEFMGVLDQFSIDLDLDKKLELGRQLNDILNREAPITGVSAGSRWYGWYRYLQGLPEVGGRSDYNTYQWDFVWLDR